MEVTKDCQHGCLVHAGGGIIPLWRFSRNRLAAQPQHALALRRLRHHRHATQGAAVEEAHRLSRAGLSRRRRLHGSGKLGDLARRRLEVRLRAAHHRAAFEPHGDPAAGAVRAAGHRRRARSGAGLPRRVPSRGGLAAVGAGGDRHLRDRPRRSDRHRHRPQSLVQNSAGNRRRHHRARCVPHSGNAAPRLPLDRILRRSPARCHRRLLCGPNCARRPRLAQGDPGFRAHDRNRDQSGNALPCHRHHGSDRDAA